MILASPVIRSFETFSGGFEYEKTIPLLFVTAENADVELVVNQSSLQAPVSLSLSLFEYPARCKISGYGGYRDLIRIQEERGVECELFSR